MTDLFNIGAYKLHSGATSDFKIDCDALSDADLNSIAYKAMQVLAPFDDIYGIPTGGKRLETAFLPYLSEDKPRRILVVDDVLTTGNSFYEYEEKFYSDWEYMNPLYQNEPDMIGFVLFARGPCPDWVRPFFTVHEGI